MTVPGRTLNAYLLWEKERARGGEGEKLTEPIEFLKHAIISEEIFGNIYARTQVTSAIGNHFHLVTFRLCVLADVSSCTRVHSVCVCYTLFTTLSIFERYQVNNFIVSHIRSHLRYLFFSFMNFDFAWVFQPRDNHTILKLAMHSCIHWSCTMRACRLHIYSLLFRFCISTKKFESMKHIVWELELRVLVQYIRTTKNV